MSSNATYRTATVDGSDMRIFVDLPAGSGPFPAVVVAHHRAGVDAATTKFVQDLAGLGYAAVAPDLHHRRPEGEDTRESLARLDDIEIVADLRAAVDCLGELGTVDSSRIAIAGHCMGGRVSFLGAAEIPAFKANVVYYGGNMFRIWGNGDATPFEKLDGLRGPVIGFFGNDDENPSPEDVAKIDTRLTELGVVHEFHAYDGCGHAFQNFTNPAGYRAAATSDSFAKMAAWLAANL